jgi:hypothetical protein
VLAITSAVATVACLFMPETMGEIFLFISKSVEMLTVRARVCVVVVVVVVVCSHRN